VRRAAPDGGRSRASLLLMPPQRKERCAMFVDESRNRSRRWCEPFAPWRADRSAVAALPVAADGRSLSRPRCKLKRDVALKVCRRIRNGGCVTSGMRDGCWKSLHQIGSALRSGRDACGPCSRRCWPYAHDRRAESARRVEAARAHALTPRPCLSCRLHQRKTPSRPDRRTVRLWSRRPLSAAQRTARPSPSSADGTPPDLAR
jgi:hypothetical protein